MAIFTQRGEKVATIGVHSGVRVRLAGGAAGADGAAGAFTVEWGEESCREALEFRRVARAGFPQRPAPTRTQPWYRCKWARPVPRGPSRHCALLRGRHEQQRLVASVVEHWMHARLRER